MPGQSKADYEDLRWTTARRPVENVNGILIRMVELFAPSFGGSVPATVDAMKRQLDLLVAVTPSIFASESMKRKLTGLPPPGVVGRSEASEGKATRTGPLLAAAQAYARGAAAPFVGQQGLSAHMIKTSATDDDGRSVTSSVATLGGLCVCDGHAMHCAMHPPVSGIPQLKKLKVQWIALKGDAVVPKSPMLARVPIRVSARAGGRYEVCVGWIDAPAVGKPGRFTGRRFLGNEWTLADFPTSAAFTVGCANLAHVQIQVAADLHGVPLSAEEIMHEARREQQQTRSVLAEMDMSEDEADMVSPPIRQPLEVVSSQVKKAAAEEKVRRALEKIDPAARKRELQRTDDRDRQLNRDQLMPVSNAMARTEEYVRSLEPCVRQKSKPMRPAEYVKPRGVAVLPSQEKKKGLQPESSTSRPHLNVPSVKETVQQSGETTNARKRLIEGNEDSAPPAKRSNLEVTPDAGDVGDAVAAVLESVITRVAEDEEDRQILAEFMYV